MKTYLIGDLLLKVNIENMKLAPGIYMDKFKYSGTWNGESIVFNGITESLTNYLENKVSGDNGVYEIYNSIEDPVYVYHWGKLFHGFLVRPEAFSVSFSPEMKRQVPPNEDWFFGVSGLHHQFLKYEGAVLHASYIDYHGKAILFAGPSKTGKSTQAALWNEFEDAIIINGDRVLLRKKNEVWNAYGFPCCGSSKICENQTNPLAIIVCLKQGDVNRIEQMTYAEKIRALVSGIEFYQWDKVEMEMVFALAEKIAQKTNMIRLVCRPEKDSVKVLKDYLIQEEIIHAL